MQAVELQLCLSKVHITVHAAELLLPSFLRHSREHQQRKHRQVALHCLHEYLYQALVHVGQTGLTPQY
jgi:hypothetical protein